MKALILSLLLLVLLPLRAFAFCDEWSTTDTVLLASALVVTEIDREQTLWFLHHTSRNEENPFVSGRPTTANVNTYAALSVGATIISACLLPVPYREFLLFGWSIAESISATHNSNLGVPILLIGANLRF